MLQLLTYFVLRDTEILFPTACCCFRWKLSDRSQLEPVTPHCVISLLENLPHLSLSFFFTSFTQYTGIHKHTIFCRWVSDYFKLCVTYTHQQSGGCTCAGCRWGRSPLCSGTRSCPLCWHKCAGTHRCWTGIHPHLQDSESITRVNNLQCFRWEVFTYINQHRPSSAFYKAWVYTAEDTSSLSTMKDCLFSLKLILPRQLCPSCANWNPS